MSKLLSKSSLALYFYLLGLDIPKYELQELNLQIQQILNNMPGSSPKQVNIVGHSKVSSWKAIEEMLYKR